MRKVPQLKKKQHHQWDPDGLTTALHWDRVADPGDMDSAANLGLSSIKHFVHNPIGAGKRGAPRVRAVITDALPLGGPGSGNWAHRGRPGKRGGSQPRDAGMTIAKGKDWLKRYYIASGRFHPFEKQARELGKERATKSTGLTSTTAHENYGRDKSNLGVDFLCRRLDGSEIDNPYLMLNEEERSRAKHDLVAELAKRTGEPYGAVNAVIRQWAASSNDTDYGSLGLQEDISAELGVELSDWQKGKISQLKEKGQANDTNHVLGAPAYNTDPSKAHERGRKIVRAMYEVTQEEFEKQGITEVVLFRGAYIPGKSFSEGQSVLWEGNAAESWTSVYETAIAFAGGSGVAVSARIPVSRILGTSRTGFGCLNEAEFVVLGNTGEEDVVTVVKPTGVY